MKIKLKLIPGINGMNQEGRNKVYRILPKTVDELRAKNDQKITYDAKKIHAIKKGELRGPDPTLTKFKLPDHREQDVKDLVPNKATVEKPKLNGMIKKPQAIEVLLITMLVMLKIVIKVMRHLKINHYGRKLIKLLT